MYKTMGKKKPITMRQYFIPRPRLDFFKALDRGCHGYNPDVFYPIPGDGNGVKLAKSICFYCPYRTPCLEYALKYREEGVWGATTDHERKNILLARRRHEIAQAIENKKLSPR